MQIQINNSAAPLTPVLASAIEADLHRALDRFDSHLTRIEVHLSDENGDKSGPKDKRCLIEARPKGLQSVIVTNESSEIMAAVSGAAGKMHRLLDTTFDRLYNNKRKGEAIAQDAIA